MSRLFFWLGLALSLGAAYGQPANCPAKNVFGGEYPALQQLIDLCHNAPESLVEELQSSPIAGVVRFDAPGKVRGPKGAAATDNLPIVSAHGMGDSCFNRGMKSITAEAGAEMGVYSVCIPTGDNRISDTINGFFLDMDSSVEVFAAKVRADPKLAGGFNAFGLSQGNNLIRGYIAKYNDPPVRSFLSINGINAGVGAFPNCSPQAEAITRTAFLPFEPSRLSPVRLQSFSCVVPVDGVVLRLPHVW
jgi:palmitoyl-protein thioesterase